MCNMTEQEQYVEIGRRRAESARALHRELRRATKAVTRGELPAAIEHSRRARRHLDTYRRRLELERLARERLDEAGAMSTSDGLGA
jgi:hypothetical protein